MFRPPHALSPHHLPPKARLVLTWVNVCLLRLWAGITQDTLKLGGSLPTSDTTRVGASEKSFETPPTRETQGPLSINTTGF